MDEGKPIVDSVDTHEQVSDSKEGEGTVAYSSHRKLLGEKKNAVAERDEWKSKYEELYNEKLEREGNKDKRIELLLQERDKWKSEAVGLKEKEAVTTVSKQVAGVIGQEFDQNDVPLVMDLFEKKHGLKSLVVTEDLEIDREQVNTLLGDLKSAYPSLKGLNKKSIKVHDVKGKPHIKQPSIQEEAAKAQSPREFAEFLRKNGMA